MTRGKKITADRVDYYTKLALERGGRVTGHGPLEPPPPAVIDDAADEKDFQSEVLKEAKRLGWACFHVYDARKSEAGWPDLVCVRDRVIWIELKSANGRLDAAQERWRDILKAAGQEWYCFRPSDWPLIIATLEGRVLP